MALPVKYKQIYADLKQEIESGVYSVGSYLPSERLLCERFEVQRMTVRKALELLVDERYISKTKGAGSKVIYSPSPSSEECSIFFVIPEHEFSQQFQPYHWEVCMAMEQICKEHGQSLYFKVIKNNEDVASWLRSTNNICGIIWDTPIDHNLLDIARDKGIPCISICSDYPNFPRINLADMGVTYDATQHLIDMGCQRIAFLKGLESYGNTARRLRGYRMALMENGIPVREELILSGNWTHDSGYEALNHLIESGIPFDGVMASNDMMAFGAIKSLYQHDIPVPYEVKVAGIDNIQYSSMSTPSLSTISFNKQNVAKIAHMFLSEVMLGHSVPDEVIVPGRLIVRESTKK